jgi:tetraacyldisaccharide 4'-kinase
MALADGAYRLHRRIIDPAERSVFLGLCRGILWAPAAIYGLAARLRNVAYDRGWLKIRRADAPTISVGNVTAGGTGKTPFVAWLCERIVSEGLHPVILSRGYGADAEAGVDDENQMLRELAPGVPVVVDPDRVAGARRAVTEHRADVLVMDDGFQHRRLHRDFDLVLIDALLPFGGGYMLPRGLLREPVAGIRRADAVVVTRADQVEEQKLKKLQEQLRRHTGTLSICHAGHVPTRLVPVGEGSARTPEALRRGRWGAFCGLGNPEGFRRTLRTLKVDLEFFRCFPDHHAYSGEEIQTMQRRALRSRCCGLLTTSKAAVKLRHLSSCSSELQILALEVRMEVRKGQQELWRSIREAIAAASGR